MWGASAWGTSKATFTFFDCAASVAYTTPASTRPASTADSAARTSSAGTTWDSTSFHSPTFSNHDYAYTPAGTMAGSANTNRFSPFSDSGPANFRFESTGTTTTNRLDSRSARVPGCTRPACWTASILATSAERKASAGAPAIA